jgi:hypothetical protein
MATKKTVEKLYVLLDSDGDLVSMDTLEEITYEIDILYQDDVDLSEYTICELGPKKKVTFIPSSIKIG